MKIRYVLCVLAVCLMLTGCQTEAVPNPTEASEGGHSAPMPGYDAQNKYMLTSILSFQETDNFFCGSNLIEEFLQYYDKASGISGVLCANPACTHDSPSCGAYMHAGATLSYYDEKLYWIANASQSSGDVCLWQSTLSGTDREKVMLLNFEDIILPYQPQRYIIHRGTLYILGLSNVVERAQAACRVSLLSVPLDKHEEVTALFNETFDRTVQPTVRFVGNEIYLSLIAFPEGGPFDVTVLKFDTQSGASQKVFEETGITEVPGDIWVTEQGEIYLPATGEDHAYLWKLENGKRVEITSWENCGTSVLEVMDGIAVLATRPDNIRKVDIVSLSGETLYSGKLLPDAIPGLDGDPNAYSFALIGGDADKLIINLSTYTDMGMVDYTLLLDLNCDLAPTILWSSQQ